MSNRVLVHLLEYMLLFMLLFMCVCVWVGVRVCVQLHIWTHPLIVIDIGINSTGERRWEQSKDIELT